MFSFKTPRPGKTATAQKRKREESMEPATRLAPNMRGNDTKTREIPSIRRGNRNWKDPDAPMHFFTQNQERSLGSLSNLPPEVALLDLKDGIVDLTSGWAVVLARQTAFVWQAAKKSSPSCKQFPLPADDCLACVVPSAGDDARLAGLLVSSRGGVDSHVEIDGQAMADPNVVELRYWADLTFATDIFKSVSVDLHSSDAVECLVNCEPAGHIMTTRMGYVYRIVLHDSKGTLACEELSTRPSGLIARVGNLLGYNPFYNGPSQEVEPTHVIRAVPGALQPSFARDGRDLFVVLEKSVAKWTLSKTAPEKFWYERDVVESINSQLSLQVSQEGVDVTLLDAAMARDNLCLLVSFPALVEGVGQVSKYAMVFVDASFNGDGSGMVMSKNQATIVSIKVLDVQRLEGAFIPKLYLPNGGPVALIVFPDALVVASVWHDNDYEEMIPLTHDDSQELILGVGVDEVSEHGQEALAWLLMHNRGVFELKVNTEHIWRSFKQQDDSMQGESHRHTRQLKSLLEQALFYGKADNPISFKLDPTSHGDLDAAVLGLADDVVNSKTTHIANVVNLKMQLGEKSNRLRGLAHFLESNDALKKLENGTRWTLYRDAQKVAAAQAVWTYQDEVVGSQDWNMKQHLHLCSQAISALFDSEKIPRPTEPVKVMRQFFSFYTDRIESLLPFILRPLSRSSAAGSNKREQASLLKEANQLVLLMLEAAWDCHSEAFSPTLPCCLEPWTASQDVLNVLKTLFESTNEHVAHNSASPLREQLGRLGSALLKCYQERIDYLQNSVDTIATSAQLQPLQALNDMHIDQRPKILTQLVRHGHKDKAYELAETYQDFDKLAELVLDNQDPQVRDEEIRKHLSTFGTDFGTVVFEKYVGSGDFKTLLSQDDGYNQALSDFFQTRQLPAYAWLHHIRVKDFKAASKDLVAFANQESNAGEKATALALAKLTAVAAQQDATLYDRPMELAQLNLVIQHDFVRAIDEHCEETGRIPPDDLKPRSDLALRLSRGKHLTQYPALAEIFKRLGMQSMKGDSLDVEDLLDLYTLRAKDGPEDFFDAFSMLAGMYTVCCNV
jgi:hypothetical protein